jgi:hypothetical protein
MTMAAAIDGYINLNVYPFGVGGAARTLAEDGILEHVAQWLPFEFSKSDLRDALWQKSLYPACLPVTQEAMAIELAAARAILQLGAHKTRDRSIGIYHSFERIIAAGSVLVRAPDLLQTLLTLLDGLQPVGITNLVIDQNGITASLGAAARFNPALAVQVLESRAYLKLATVICPVSKAKVGTVILEGRMQYEDGTEHIFEVEQGSLIRLPLENGKVARLRCIPHRGTWLAPYGKRKDEWVTITGGFYGAVIDARGRPLMLPADPTLRRETLHKWSISLGIA